MDKRIKIISLLLLGICLNTGLIAQKLSGGFRAIVLFENGGHHLAYSQAARKWIDSLAAATHFTVDYINSTDSITTPFLSRYRLFIQLDYPPYGWAPAAAAAFQKYIAEGWGGWIGFHHATLLGEFDGFPLWHWYAAFMGNIRFKNYVAGFADAAVKAEDSLHPVMKGVPPVFEIIKEEWYTYDKSPRPYVQVLARVDESTYRPGSDIKMGDHPVVWVNTNVKAPSVYIFMGHGPWLFQNTAYTTLFKNAIFWAAGQ